MGLTRLVLVLGWPDSNGPAELFFVDNPISTNHTAGVSESIPCVIATYRQRIVTTNLTICIFLHFGVQTCEMLEVCNIIH